MIKKIYKYIIPVEPEQQVTLPKGFFVVDVQNQNGSIALWALVDVAEANETIETIEKTFVIFGTGQEIPNIHELRWLNTVQVGEFVWHIFLKN